MTKYPYKILRGDIAERAREVMRQKRVAREVTIIHGAVSPDHVHVLVAVPPSRHSGLDANAQPTNRILRERRKVAIPPAPEPEKNGAGQPTMVFQ